MDNEPAESLLVRIRGWSCSDDGKKPRIHKLWSTWGALTTLIPSGGTTQEDTSNPGGFKQCTDKKF